MLHENTVDYILGRFTKQDGLNAKMNSYVKVTDDAIRTMTKELTKLKRQNGSMTAFSVLCIVFGYLGVKKIKELEKEIKELKKLKGE